jgi:hypothetical protein
MIISINKPSARKVFVPFIIALAMILCCFKSSIRMDANEAVAYSNHCLNESYDASGDAKVKKVELSVTEDLFVRFRKTYTGGKQDYYSFRVKRFSDLTYMGTATKGSLILKTDADNVIQQTYNDPKGNEDNMMQTMSIPVKSMEPERLDSLRTALLFLRNGK